MGSHHVKTISRFFKKLKVIFNSFGVGGQVCGVENALAYILSWWLSGALVGKYSWKGRGD